MSIVCTICHDAVTERPQCLPEEAEVIVVALQCGHIFHQKCIQIWSESDSIDKSQVDCPCCKKRSSLASALRLYPSDEQEGAAHARMTQTQGLALLEELDDSRLIVRQLTANLDTETLNYALLKSENEKLQYDMNQLRKEMKDNEEMCKCLVESSKCEMENLKKENDELKRRLENGGNNVDCEQLRQQLELLKTVQEETKGRIAVCLDMEKNALDQILQSLSNTTNVSESATTPSSGGSSERNEDQDQAEAVIPLRLFVADEDEFQSEDENFLDNIQFI